MCFSAQADLVGGVVVGALGIDALRHVRRPRELAIASLPLLLGLHQLIEAFVWWGLEGHVSQGVGNTAMWIYLIIAFVVLPVYVPLAVIAIEPVVDRRQQMIPFAVAGAGVSVVLFSVMLRGPVTAELAGLHIAYGIGLPYSTAIVGLYVLATCGSLLASSYPAFRIFGAVNLCVVCLLAWFQKNGFASLWCAWAAVASGAIVAYLRLRTSRAPQATTIPA